MGNPVFNLLTMRRFENKVILLRLQAQILFQIFIIYHSCTTWGWLNTIGFQNLWIFLDYYMQVTMKIFGILKIWNSKQALTWRETWPVLESTFTIAAPGHGMWNLGQGWLLAILSKCHHSKIDLKKCNSGCSASSESKANWQNLLWGMSRNMGRKEKWTLSNSHTAGLSRPVFRISVSVLRWLQPPSSETLDKWPEFSGFCFFFNGLGDV